MNRVTAASVLALLDRPWCWEDLAAVLRESDDWMQTAAVRIILRNSKIPMMEKLVSDWETAHECNPNVGVLFETAIAMRSLELSGLVNRVRDQVPDP
jgi:hypothetical protein